MPVYFFFKKGNHVNVLESNDSKGASCLREWGYKKQSEELNAPDAHHALARFHYIRSKNAGSEYAFSTGAVIVTLIVGLFAAADYFW